MKKLFGRAKRVLITSLVFVFIVSLLAPASTALAAQGLTIDLKSNTLGANENIFWGVDKYNSDANSSLLKLQTYNSGAYADKFRVDVNGKVYSASSYCDSNGNNCLVPGSGMPAAGSAGNTLYSNGTSWVASQNIYNNNGNVGIGTTGPTSKLHIYGGTYPELKLENAGAHSIMDIVTTGAFEEGIRFYHGATRQAEIYTYNGDGILRFNNSAGDVMAINGGNVGIGKTSPLAKLDVMGELRISNTSGTGGDYDNYPVRIVSYYSGDAMKIFANSGREYFGVYNYSNTVLGLSGNVGIGTTAPGYKLQVNGEIYANTYLMAGSYVAANNYNAGQIALNSSGSDYGNISNPSAQIWSLGHSPTQGTVGTSVLTWTATNNVGIGTASPNAKLSVNGPISVYNGVATANYPISIRQTNTNQYLDIESTGNYEAMTMYYNPTARAWYSGIRNADDSSAYHIYSDAYGGDAFRISGGGTVYVPGNVGIGTTAPNGTLEIYRDNILSATQGNLVLNHPSSGGANSIVFPSRVNYGSDYGYITYYDDNDSYNYWGNGAENSALVIGTQNDPNNANSDVVVLKPAASTIVDSQMIVNGNVGIGTTNPGYKLDVWGSANIRGYGLTFTPGGSMSSYLLTPYAGSTAGFTINEVGVGNELSVRTGGNVGIGTDNPNYKFEVSGDVYANGGWLRTSGSQGVYWESQDTRIFSDSSTYIKTRSDNGWVFYDRSANLSGYVYHDGSGNFGLLGNSGGWSVRVPNGSTDVVLGGNTYLNGNLYFNNSNPYLSASSYFIAPGGAYFNGGTVYTEATLQARGGIHDDAHSYLTIAGGTSGNTYFSGNVGIQTASPAYSLDVVGGIKASGQINAAGGIIQKGGGSFSGSDLGLYSTGPTGWLRFVTNSGYMMFFSDGGSYNSGNSPIMQLAPSGNLTISGLLTQSDIRLKENIAPLDNSLSKVLSLNGVSFYWKPGANKDSSKQIGFIAQDVEKVVPELVKTDMEGIKSVEYANMNALLVEAMKEQQKKIDNQQEEIDTLKEAIKNLQK